MAQVPKSTKYLELFRPVTADFRFIDSFPVSTVT